MSHIGLLGVLLFQPGEVAGYLEHMGATLSAPSSSSSEVLSLSSLSLKDVSKTLYLPPHVA